MAQHPARLTNSADTVLGYRRNGRPIYPIAGGSGESDTGSEGQAADAGTDDTVTTTGADDAGTDLAADVAKWKALARKHETRSAANAAAAQELEALKASMLTDSERAITEAEKRGRDAANADFGQKLAAAKIEAALTGIIPDPSAVVEDLNLAKYVTDTGDVDLEAVTALRAKYQSIAAKTPPPDLNQGSRGGNRVDIDQQIAEASAAGNHALAISLKRSKAYANRT